MADKPAPKPGHFLPGGDGDQIASDDRKPGVSAPSKAPSGAPLAAPTPRLAGEAPPTPPQLSGSRIDSRRTTLSGSRIGPPPAEDRAAAAYRQVYHPEPVPFVPKQRSKGLIALMVVAVLLLLGGGATFAVKVISSPDFSVNPIPPTTKPSGGAPTTKPPVGKGTPDTDIVGKNAIYTAGALAAAKCAEPAFRPTSMENVRSYYQALTACMDKAWEPIVTKAGFEFRSPNLVIFSDGDETACGVQHDLALYCQDEHGGSATMPWQELVEEYPKNKAEVRAEMAQSFGFVYGVHLQNLTGMAEASDNLADTAASKAAQLEMNRRAALQAYCFGAVFFGAARTSFPLRGELLRQWNGLISRRGDEFTKDKVRDHGSSKSLALWMNQGLATSNPGSCNTFVAASAKVS
ncbi:putative neutral zinc metallopeptidase [Kribbella sp. VKM Ac-2569]|uniref:neutral zinc metallopeptidase n=1 Tax=Kribbella sp. VKM Ac-2569 TaxID=2512220 RepID=UPI00102AC6D8|nr:neutral zinc metallopeptidase [Kribbella sp. VKM Ac-2569]RZT28472.1 putative neutral zinc metallopeptidase [Kribbella sp. VKM Ac-2569]